MYLDLFLELFEKNPELLTELLELWEMNFHLENINLIRKCYETLLLYSPSTTQHNFLFSKTPISAKSQVSDGLCVSKMSFHLENINMLENYYEDLLLYSPSITQHNFLFFKIPISAKFRVRWWTMFFPKFRFFNSVF